MKMGSLGLPGLGKSGSSDIVEDEDDIPVSNLVPKSAQASRSPLLDMTHSAAVTATPCAS